MFELTVMFSLTSKVVAAVTLFLNRSELGIIPLFDIFDIPIL